MLKEITKIEGQKQHPNYSGFVVIGAGLPRTGTASLRSALGQLLDGACYHMQNVGTGTQLDLDFWTKALDGDAEKRDWIDFLQRRGFRAGVDAPICLFYKELMEAYPEAKVVLTVRDPVKWYNSVRSTIYQGKFLGNNPAVSLFMKLLGEMPKMLVCLRASEHPPKGFDQGIFGAVGQGEEAAVAFCNRWNDEVRRHVPRDRLLEFEVKDGWEPLCRFLDLPVPDMPFPNLNDAKEIQKKMRQMKLISYFFVLLLPLMLAGLFYFVFFR